MLTLEQYSLYRDAVTELSNLRRGIATWLAVQANDLAKGANPYADMLNIIRTGIPANSAALFRLETLLSDPDKAAGVQQYCATYGMDFNDLVAQIQATRSAVDTVGRCIYPTGWSVGVLLPQPGDGDPTSADLLLALQSASAALPAYTMLG